MLSIDVDGLVFVFDGWEASKVDDWNYYKNMHQGLMPGIKAVDLLAVAPENVIHFIEVKDYRRPDTLRPEGSKLVGDVVSKVIGSMSTIFSAQLRSPIDEERRIAHAASTPKDLKVTLHCETPDERAWVEWQGLVLQKLRQKFSRIQIEVQLTSVRNPPTEWLVQPPKESNGLD